MAEIRPLQAWRYNKSLSDDIGSLTSPLFDVVSEKQRLNLYRNPFNSIHINLPQPPLPAERAAMQLEDWKARGILCQDRLPAIYVYYQYFRIAGTPQELCRKGFICNIRLYHWAENVIQRHENTIPGSVHDRLEMLEKTELNVSPTHGLYTDSTNELERYMDDAILNPVLETEDYQGVRDVMAVIHDARVINLFIDTIKGQKIILADGHHRYEGSLAYMHEQKRANPLHTGKEGYNFHMMYLTNTESDNLKILPTHRLINGLPHFDSQRLIEKLEKDFIIKPVEDADVLNEIIVGKKWAFGLVFKDNAYKVRLKPEKIQTLNWPFPPEVKDIDLTVMHYFIIQKGLGIRGRDQRRSEHITFDRSFADCLKKVNDGDAQMAIITNEVSIEEVKRVCASGYTMPQKSTYFYPKAICGFLFSSIRESEFKASLYSPF
jgi:uncharacterized protein (DUF1015 family)